MSKKILVIDDDDLENLVIAAVPNLNLEADDLELGSHGERLKALRLRSLASDLNSLPSTNLPPVVNISNNVN